MEFDLTCFSWFDLLRRFFHFVQPDWLTKTLEYSNIVFCVLFATEMGFKVLAYGPFGYIADGFNLFDGFIVVLR